MLLSTLVLAAAGAGQFITLGDWGGMALAKDPKKQYVAERRLGSPSRWPRARLTMASSS